MAKISLFALLIATVMVACKKDPIGSHYSKEQSPEEISESIQESSDTETLNASETFALNIDGMDGELTLTLSQDGELKSAEYSAELHNYLLNRYGEEEIDSFSQKLLKDSKSIKANSTEFWGNRTFIPTMSKEEFDRRAKRCENLPTEVGAIFCFVRLLIEAVQDCARAETGEAHIHCW